MSELSAKLNLIWYGDFEVHQNNPCTSFNLEDHQATIKRVYRVEGNTWPTYRSGATGNTFTTLECGYAYIVELTDANQSVNIPHANLSPGDSTAPRGLLVAEVTLATPSPSPSPTPSPTPVSAGCIPSDYVSVPHHSGTQPVNGLGNVVFGVEGTFGYAQSDFSDTQGFPRTYMIKLSGETAPAVFVTASNFPAAGTEPTVYFEKSDGACYGGDLKPIAGTDNWEVNLELIGAGPSPSPTPTPSPSPSPVVVAECGKPDDDTYGSFDLAAAYAEPEGDGGRHRTYEVTIANEKVDRVMLCDLGDWDYLRSLGIAEADLPGMGTFLQFKHRPAFGEIRGEFLFSKKQDPRPVANFNGLRQESYAFFEDALTNGKLEASAADLIAPNGSCPFVLNKFIKGDEDIFLKLDGKCFKATWGSADDAATRTGAMLSNNIPVIIFREV